MTLPLDGGRLTADVARSRATAERERANRAAAIARRHEVLAFRGPEHQRALHAEVGATHRRLQRRHRTAAELHARHAKLLERWAASTGQRDPVPPAFISSVAGSLGSRSAAISLLGKGGVEALVVASDTIARAAQDLEFVLGEGPSRDARGAGSVIVASGAAVSDRWPRYGPALARLGVHAVASAPLTLPDLCLGALTVLDPRPAMEDSPSSPLRALTDTLTHTVLLTDAGTDGGLPESPLLDTADLRAVVHQAAGMVSVQNDCTVADAIDLIRARAFADDQPLDTIATRIVDRHLRLN